MAKPSEASHIEEHKMTETVSDECHKSKNIDSLHGDEALKVIAAAGGDDYWSETEESRVVRKIDRRLMPILCITYGIQYYDKAMLAQAVNLPLTLLSMRWQSSIPRLKFILQSY